MNCLPTQAQRVSTFVFKREQVRIFDRDGEPWFILSDVCEVLGISKYRDAGARLRDSQRGSVVVDTLGGPQETSIISESGLYSLIMRSRKPEAEAFADWVTDEVLPSIRKTGSYGKRHDINLRDPAQLGQLTAQLAELFQEEREKTKQLTAELATATPKAQALDRISTAYDSLCLTDAAKALQVRPIDLNQYLVMAGWIYKRSGNAHYVGYATQVKKGYVTHKVTTIQRKTDGTDKIVQQVRITPAGLARLAQIFEERSMEAV